MAVRSTIYEVARRSGVSTATVSRVMADGTGFSAATRDRVRATAAELGWFPNGPARGLASRRTGIVGLIFPDLGGSPAADDGRVGAAGGPAGAAGGPAGAAGGLGAAEEESPLYVDQVIRGAERAATAAGNAVLIAATQTESGRKLAMSVAAKVDGLVVLARSLPDEDIVTISRTVPVVLLASRLAAGAAGCVRADNRGGSRAITEHLITAHRITELAFLSGPDGSPDSDERFAGFGEALRAAGLPVPRRPAASGGFTESGGEQAVRRLLAAGGRPRAIVCGNDEMALGALTALRDARLRVPADVAVTGFDDIAAARHVRPGLSTVRQPMRALGERSVRLLLDRIAAQDEPSPDEPSPDEPSPDEPSHDKHSDDKHSQVAVLPVELVIRRSCGCPGRATAGQLTGRRRA